MLKTSFNTIVLFNVNSSSNSINENEALVLSGCKVITLIENKVYSELEEMNHCYLNSNDYNYGSVVVELCFDNVLKNPYSEFFVNCVSIRTEKGVLCKENVKSVPFEKNYTKITKDGKLSIGIGYFFKDEKEKEALNNCKSFCVEGFVALKKKKNVFGFMCCVEKSDSGDWFLSDGNTYKTHKNINILNLQH